MPESLTYIIAMPDTPILLCFGIACVIAIMLLDAPELDGMSCRNLFVCASAPPGGNGDRETPFRSIQEAIDKHDADWGGIYILPGIYREDVDIHRGVFWIMPAQQYGVIVEGTITVGAAWTKIRGLDIRSGSDGIVVTNRARNTEIGHCRIVRIGEGCAGIKLQGTELSNCLVIGNVIGLEPVDSEPEELKPRSSGIQIVVEAGAFRDNWVCHNRVSGCDIAIQVIGEAEYGDPSLPNGTSIRANTLTGNRAGIIVANAYVRALGNIVTGVTGTAIGLHGTRGFVGGNRVTGGQTGIVCVDCRQTPVANNIVSNCLDEAIVVTGEANFAVSNTIHSDAATGSALLRVQGWPGGAAQVKHNIIAGPGELIETAEGDVVSHNLFSHALPKKLAGEFAMVGDPRFVAAANGDFRLREDSPAIGRVRERLAEIDIDGYGRPRGKRGSLGAHEMPGTPEPRTLYVGPGAGSGDGSEHAPFGSVESATRASLPGDTIILLPGAYSAERAHILGRGAPAAPLTIRSQKRHEAIFDGTQMRLDECAYVRIEGIKLVNPPHEGIRVGERACHCEFVDNLIIRETEGGGHAVAVVGPGACDNLFEGNTIKLNAGGCGIHIWCQRFNFRETIRNNDISGCYYAVQTGVGSYPSATPGYHIIENNDFHHNTRDGYHSKTTDDTLRHNDIHHNGTGGVTTRYGSRNVIVGNRIHHNKQYGIRLHSCSHFIVNNLVYGNGGHGIHLSANAGTEEDGWPYNAEPSYEPPHEVWIAHNTIVGNSRHPIDVDNGSRVMALRNIIAGSGTDAPGVHFGPGGVARLVENNLYHNARPPLLREYEGGVYEVIGDPEFADVESGDLRPAADGPAYSGLVALQDALGMMLSEAPAGSPLPPHIGGAIECGALLEWKCSTETALGED